MRTIIQIATHAGNGTEIGEIIALCDDGTMWHISKGQDWVKVPDIPEDPEPYWIECKSDICGTVIMSDKCVETDDKTGYHCPDCGGETEPQEIDPTLGRLLHRISKAADQEKTERDAAEEKGNQHESSRHNLILIGLSLALAFADEEMKNDH